MGYLVLIIIIFVADFIIKKRVEEKRSLGKQESFLNGKIILEKYYNRGFALDKFEKHPKLVAFGSALVCILLCLKLVFLLPQKGYKGLKLAFSMMIGGAASNIYDRFTKHYVVDYISFGVKWKFLREIVFNLSDFFIIPGTLFMLMVPKPDRKK